MDNEMTFPEQNIPHRPSMTKQQSSAQSLKQILISASFTAAPILQGLEFWQKELGLDYNPKILNYNQVFQDLLNPESLFHSNVNGLNVILLRFEDWLPSRADSYNAAVQTLENDELLQLQQKLQKTLHDFLSALRTFLGHAPCQTLLLICPVSQSFRHHEQWKSCFLELTEHLKEQTKNLGLLCILEAKEFHARYQVVTVDDPVRNEIAHIPYVDEYYHFLSTLLVRYYHGLFGKSFKVIVVDCDNTLWQGVCGEASPGELEADGSFKELHQFLVEQQKSGMLLCLCSKNLENDVWNVFANRPDFPLQREYLADCRINWQPKSENLRSLAETLNLGLDSFIFIDDNPIECAEVQANCPAVLTLQWPANEEDRSNLMQHTWAFDHLSVTAEDTIRTIMTQQNLQRQSLLKKCTDFNEFLEKLALEVDILPVETKHLARVSQLTKRTNQFNFTTIRRNENEMQNLLAQEGYECRIVQVKDRFGEYGLVGVLIFQQGEQELSIDSFILSCRVLGRGIEHKMMAELGKVAVERQRAYVSTLFAETEKNKPARNFLDSIAGQLSAETTIDNEQKQSTYLFAAKSLSALYFIPPSAPEYVTVSAQESNEKKAEDYSWRPAHMMIKTAGALTNVGRISQKINAPDELAAQEPEVTAAAACNSGKEKYAGVLEQVRKIFSKILSIDGEKINADEKFENYINNSLKIVELTVEMQKKFPDISATFLFEHSSLEEIAHVLCGMSAPAGSSDIKDRFRLPGADKMANQEKEMQNDAVAIVGISGRFPMAKDVHEFWNNLRDGRDCITEIPKARWDWREYYGDLTAEAYKTNIKWGGFIDGIDEFDPLFFGISPREAELMDPQQRLLLTHVWLAMEDGGISPGALSQYPTGVFVAAGSSEYINVIPAPQHKPLAMTAGAQSYLPNRISYMFNLHGPSEYIDTACSAALVAVHRAVQAIRQHECEQAVVGAVNLLLSPLGFIGYEALGYLSPDGQSKSFQAGANGYVRSEGIGVIIIKSLQKAVEDGDTIYAVLKGTGVCHGGRGMSLTAPSLKGMKAAMVQAYQAAKVDPQTVAYIEAHGIAAPLGDSIEINALKAGYGELAALYSQNLEASAPCYIGSLKPSIGNGEQVSGMAALLKVILAIRHRLIPGIPLFTSLHENVSVKGSPLQISTENRPWETLTDAAGNMLPRRAGINSFGSGGVNAHLIIEEYTPPRTEPDDICNTTSPQVMVFSARNQERLLAVVQQMLEFLTLQQEIALANIAYTLQVGREAMECRLAMVVNNRDELIQGLQEYLEWVKTGKEIETCIPMFTGDLEEDHPKIRTLFSGKAGEAILQLFLSWKDFEKLALYWTQGGHIPWESLHKGQTVHRISLPNYPFARERYWIANESEERRRAVSQQFTAKQGFHLEELTGENVRNYLVGFLAQELKIVPDRIGLNKNFQAYGADSIIIIRLIRDLKKQFEINVTAREMLEYRTVTHLAAHVTRKITERNA